MELFNIYLQGGDKLERRRARAPRSCFPLSLFFVGGGGVGAGALLLLYYVFVGSFFQRSRF